MIEATLRVWITADTDDLADEAAKAMVDAARDLGAVVVMVEQNRREVER
jgi:hypothetical protein